MVLQENYDLSVRQAPVVIGRNVILTDHKVANSGETGKALAPVGGRVSLTLPGHEFALVELETSK